MVASFKILFDNNGNPKNKQFVRHELLVFSESYDRVVKIIIDNSLSLNETIFRFNVATLMPPFGMTRTPTSVFYGMKIENGIPRDSNYHLFNACWKQYRGEFEGLKGEISKNASQRNRALLELAKDSRDSVISKMSVLFDKLEWTTIEGIDIGRVGASKILFAVFPEIALPVDNAEWDYVFRTHDYGKVLSSMLFGFVFPFANFVKHR